jgi:hypothetical protein
MLLLRLPTRVVDMISTRSRVRLISTHGDLLTVMIPLISIRTEYMTVTEQLINSINNFTISTAPLISTKTSHTNKIRPTATRLTKDPSTKIKLMMAISPATSAALATNPPAMAVPLLSLRTHSVQTTEITSFKAFLVSPPPMEASLDLAHTNIRPLRLPHTK